MSLWHALILGLVQGLGEFLPISSSGHLTIAQNIFGLADAPLTLSILLHLGTLCAVFAVYWQRIWGLLRHPLKSELKWLIVATIPAVVATLLLGDWLDALFSGAYLGIFFLLTSAVLLVGEAASRARAKRHGEVTFADALAMGCMQALAIAPGLSRSGSTIAGGLCSGLGRKEAADFSFLMSIPAILGSVAFDGLDIVKQAQANSVSLGAQLREVVAGLGGALPLLVGMLTAAICGFLAIKFMLYLIRRVPLSWFAAYTALLGIGLIAHQMFF